MKSVLRNLYGSVLLVWAGTAWGADAELRAFVDGVMQSHLSEQTTIGATVAVVQDGQLLLSSGYGFSDAAAQRKVDSSTTLFRVGSVSKVLVWMSVLQQVERTGAALDQDLAEYLQTIALDKRYPAPVTLRHLMTHSAGFEDRLYGLFTDSASRVPTLQEYLQRNVPQQIALPGQSVAYSNYGAALAARVVENTSGVAFNDYVADAIFAPLGMQSTFSQEQNDDWQRRLSQGYRVIDGRPQRQPVEYVTAAPAGAMSASATDLAALMIELLEPASSAVLSSEAKQQLLRRARSTHPDLNGMTLGLYEMTQGDGERSVGHGGDTMLFHSRMVLWPEQQLGLFVSTNTATGAAVVSSLVDAFTARYQLVERPNPAKVAANLQVVMGHYGSNRRAESGPLKALALLSQIRVARSANEDVLRLSGALPSETYEARGDNLFYATNGVDRVHFLPAADGTDRLVSSAVPVLEFVRLRWFERADINGAFVAVAVLLNLLLLLRLPYTAVFRRLRSTGDRVASAWGASSLAWLLALTILVVLALYVRAVPDPVSFMLGGYRRLAQLNWAWLIIAAGAVLQVFFALRAWTRGYWWLARRGFYSLVALCNLGFAAWLYYWNLHPFGMPTA